MDDPILTNTTDRNNLNPSDYTWLYQDTACLTELLQLSYPLDAKKASVYEQAFIRFLQDLVQSIGAVCQQNPAVSNDYETYYLQFRHGIEYNVWQQANTAQAFFHTTASLIQCGIESFRACQYPQGYSGFLYHLESLFNNENIMIAGKQRIAYLLLEQLRQKP